MRRYIACTQMSPVLFLQSHASFMLFVQDIEGLLQTFSRIKISSHSVEWVDCLARLVNRIVEHKSVHSAALKSAGIEELLALFLLRLCDCFEHAPDDPQMVSTLAQDVLGILDVSSGQLRWCKPVLGQLCLQAGRSHMPLLTVASLLESLGYACVSSEPSIGVASAENSSVGGTGAVLTDSGTAADHNREALLQRVRQLCGPALSPGELRRQAVEELTQRIQAAHLYLSRLPAPAAVPKRTVPGEPAQVTDGAKSDVDVSVGALTAALKASKLGTEETTTSGAAVYAETVNQLRTLLSSLKALAYLCEHSTSATTGAAKQALVKLSATEISAYFGLVPLIDRILRNVMPTLGRRLQLVAEAAERTGSTGTESTVLSNTVSTTKVSTAATAKSLPTAASGVSSTGTDTAIGASGTSGTPKKTLLGKTDAYRPPAQRSTAAATQPAGAAEITGSVANDKVAALASTKSGTGAGTGASTLVDTMVVLKGQLSAQLVRLLGAVAALNPTVFVSSWGLFLSDSIISETGLQERSREIVRVATGQATASESPAVARSRLSAAPATSGSGVGVAKLSSPILGTVLHSATAEVRAAAALALLRFLSGLPLRTYFSVNRPGTIGRVENRSSSSTSRAVGGTTQLKSHAPMQGGGVNAQAGASAMSKQQKILLKIVGTLVVALDTEQSETVLELLLKLAALLLDQMPLSDNWRAVRNTRFAALTADSANLCEGRAMSLYVLAVRVALRYDVPELAHPLLAGGVSSTQSASAESTGVPKPRNISASYVALTWLAERCKNANNTNALYRALCASYLSQNSNGGSAAIYAAAQCLLRAVAPANTNNLYCGAVRTLNSCLAQYFPALYVADPAWLCNLFSVLEIHAQAGLRLQGSKMQSFLLDYDLPNIVVLPAHLPLSGDFVRDVGTGAACYVGTFTQCNAAGRTLEDNFASMLRSCGDDAHIVRTQAMATLGSLTSYVWRVLHGLTCSKAEHLQYNAMQGTSRSGTASPDAAVITKRLLLLRCLLVGAKDSVGTVRTSAYKSLGDCVVNNALLLSAPAVTLSSAANPVHPLLNAAELAFMNDLMSCLAVGILDTKLSVRVQAAWALGNTIVNLLPYRWSHGYTALSAAGGAIRVSVKPGTAAVGTKQQSQMPSWLTDSCWIALFSDLLPLLHDSEKLAATVIRCVGNVGAGLFPHLSQLHRETVCTLHEALIQRYLVPSYTPPTSAARTEKGADYWQVLSNLRTPVTEHTQKVVFSLAQSLGFVLHALSQDVGRSETLLYVSEVMEVHMSFLKYGKLKTQLQAAQVLLYGQCLTKEVLRESTLSGDTDHVVQLIRYKRNCIVFVLCPLPHSTSGYGHYAYSCRCLMVLTLL
jgi:hypothetical protein